jgi:hypothetical protein
VWLLLVEDDGLEVCGGGPGGCDLIVLDITLPAGTACPSAPIGGRRHCDPGVRAVAAFR